MQGDGITPATTVIAMADDAVAFSGIPDRGPSVFAVTTATLALASLFVAGRMVSRFFIVRRVTWDDYIMVLAWVLAVFLAFSIDYGTQMGLGRRDVHIAAGDRMRLRTSEYVFSILYNPALMANKSSILVFYLRLARNTQPVLRRASWAMLILVNLAGTILTLMNIFQCKPISAAWDPSVQTEQCLPLLTEFICSAPVNVVTDLAILALPLPVLTSMRLPRRQKVILILTFTLGIFVSVVDVVRIYFLQQAITIDTTWGSSDRSAVFGASVDFAWNASLSLMWSAVEVNVGIVCACVPMLKPLIVRILPAMINDRYGSAGGGNQTRESQLRNSNNNNNNNNSRYIWEPDGGNGGNTNTAIAGGRTMGVAAAESQQAYNLSQPPIPTPLRLPARRQSAEISFMDFITVPAGMGFAAEDHSNATPTTATTPNNTIPPTANSLTRSSVYFGFVNMKQPKSMLKTSASESFKYCTIVSILFFLWGFSYGLLNTLNNVVAEVAKVTAAQAIGLTSMYFGCGYLLGPLLVGEWILRRDEHRRRITRHHQKRMCRQHDGHPYPPKTRDGGWDPIGGFKTTFILGLLIYGVGTVMFWPSAVMAAFGGFMVSSFVVGFGLAVLETAANPFIHLTGPPEYAEMRLLLAQGVQGVGSVLSGLLADNIFFRSIKAQITSLSATPTAATTMSLLDVQWTYLAVTLLSVLLALFFYYMPLPEVGDRELAELAARLPVDPKKRSVAGWPLRNWTVALAVTAQWFYVAAQESMSIYFRDLLTAFAPVVGASNTSNTTTATTATAANSVMPLIRHYTHHGMTLSPANYLLVAHTAFALSRFGAGYLAYLSVRHPTSRAVPAPRTVLAASSTLSLASLLVAVLIKPRANPNLMAVPLVLFLFAEGPVFPLLFSLGLRGQGERTKRAAAWLTMGASGPVFWPFTMFGILRRGGSIQVAFVVVLGLTAVTLAYPAFVALVPDARAMVDFSGFSAKEAQERKARASGEGLGGFPALGPAAAAARRGGSSVGMVGQGHRNGWSWGHRKWRKGEDERRQGGNGMRPVLLEKVIALAARRSSGRKKQEQIRTFPSSSTPQTEEDCETTTGERVAHRGSGGICGQEGVLGGKIEIGHQEEGGRVESLQDTVVGSGAQHDGAKVDVGYIA